MANTVAVLMRKAPYGSVYTAEGFRSMMGIGVFEMDICVVFADDGVYALVKGQNPAALDMKPLGDGFPQLGDFGVTKLYAHDRSLKARGLTQEDLVMPVAIVDDAALAGLLESAGIVLPF